MKGKKRRILKLMREGHTQREAAEAVGITPAEVMLCGALKDKEFGRAIKALQTARIIDFVLKWDDEVRSGRPLNLAEQNCVYVARRIARQLGVDLKQEKPL
jgi:hypothetical protein